MSQLQLISVRIECIETTLIENASTGVLYKNKRYYLTHWGRVTHICIGKLTIIDSDNGLSPGRRQTIIWTNAGILLIRTLGTNFSEILSEIRAFSFKKMHLKMSSGKWRPSCLGLKVLRCKYKAEKSYDALRHIYVSKYKKNDDLRSIMSNLQLYCCLKVDFQKVDKHTGGKWLIHDTKRRKDNQWQSLKVPFRIS